MLSRAPAGAAGNGLLNALVAYWPGDEANGDRLDVHTNALHLTDTNTVTSDTGLVYATARQYTRANGEYHTRPGDDALLSGGNVDFTIAAWVYLDDLSAHAIATKYNASGLSCYALWYSILSANRFALYVRNATNTGTYSAVANTFGVPVVNTWYLVIGMHSVNDNKVYIQINDGSVDSGAGAGGVDSAAVFKIGTWSVGNNPMNGRIGPTAFWKSAPGGGGVLTAEQRTALWNAGAGLKYEDLTA